MRRKMTFKLLLLSTLLMVLFWINMNHPSLAFYNFDGYEITWMAYGKIHGDLYVAGGHGLDATPYTEVFSIPPGNEVIWAEALIGVWGGNEYNTGWIETHVNGSSLGIQNINALNDQNSNILGSTNGVYLVHYNVTSHIDLNKSLDITVNTGGIFDGRVYGIVLLAVLNNSNNVTKFCIGFGNTGLHHMILGRSHDQFSFNIQDNYNKSEFQSTELIVSYLTGTLGENDYLFFNENLLSSDAGNEGAGGYFDFDSYDVLSYVTESNTVRFHRGDETYIHPTLSILKATYNATLGEDPDYIYFRSDLDGPNRNGGIPVEIIILIIAVITVVSIATVLFGYQYWRKRRNKK